MSQELQKIEAELLTTKAEIRRSWEIMKSELGEGVQSVGADIRQTLNLKHQVVEHPVEMVTGAALVGFLLGALSFRKAPVVNPTRQTFSPFQDELSVFKGLLVATALNKAAGKLGEMVPSWKDPLDTISQRVSHKIQEATIPSVRSENFRKTI